VYINKLREIEPNLSPTQFVNTFLVKLISITIVCKKDLIKMIGQKASRGQPRTIKSTGYLIFPTSTSTFVTIPKVEIYYLLSSLIVIDV
jgi:hypothetical protein